jgi:osmotically-inducible protein OsmY
MEDKPRRTAGEIALKIGVVGAIGVGAVISGMFVSRRGRHLLREAWQGRRRSRIEDRVLDALWGDPVLGRRELEVQENPEGTITLSGVVHSEQERRVATAMAKQVKGVDNVVDELRIERGRTRGGMEFRRKLRRRIAED